MESKSKIFVGGIVLLAGLQTIEPCLEALHPEKEPQGDEATLSTKRVTLPPEHHTPEKNEAPQPMYNNLILANTTSSATINVRGLDIKFERRLS